LTGAAASVTLDGRVAQGPPAGGASHGDRAAGIIDSRRS